MSQLRIPALLFAASLFASALLGSGAPTPTALDCATCVSGGACTQQGATVETVLSRATKRNERNPGWVNISLDWYTANRWVDCGGGYSLRVGAVKGLRGKRVRFKGRGSLVVTQNVIGVGGDERFEFGNFEVITTGDGSGDISVSLEEETLQQIKTSLHRPSQFGWKAEIFFFVEEVSGPATDQTSLTVELTTVP